MKRAAKLQSTRRPVVSNAERSGRGAGTFAIVDSRPQAVQLKKLQATADDSFRPAARLQAMLGDSPRLVAQRRRIKSVGHSRFLIPTLKTTVNQEQFVQPPSHVPAQLKADLEEEEPLQGKFGVNALPTQFQTPSPPAENRTGMPDRLKSGLERLSGLDLSAARVHRNSAKPAQLNALAYTQGSTIEVGPGQERHLPHEGWHLVQQMQGRVKPTLQTKGVSINDDGSLEREADVMGAKALKT